MIDMSPDARTRLRLPLCAFALLVLAAEPAAADPQRPQAKAIEAHTRFLADDLLEGRDTATRGYDIAAAYVAAQYRSAGLRPGVDGSYFQTITMRRRTLESIEVGYAADGQTMQLENGRDVALDASPYVRDERLELELVFVGWGIDAPHLGLDDYANLDVRGKAVVLLEGAPPTLAPALRAHYSWIQQKERMAAARGAAAVLTLKAPAREKYSPWERTRKHRPLPAVGWVGERRPGEILPPAATMTLGPDFARRLFGRAGRDIEAIYRSADDSPPRGFALPGRVTITRSSRHEDAPSANVIGVLPGADPKLRDEYVVVAAHLDHVGVGPEVGGDRIYNGAIDNAGGVAVMMEAARALAAGPPPRRTTIFIATTGEEKGLLGADYYVTYPTVPLEKVVAAISVDGLMTFHDFGGIVALGADHSTLGEISRRAAGAIEAVHVPDPIPDRGNLALSDQYPFLRHGVPVLFPNPARGLPRSGPDGAAEWDAYEATAYHQPSDETDLPIRWDMAERWGRYIYGVIAGAANDPRPPTWYAHDPLADAFAPDAPRAAKPRG